MLLQEVGSNHLQKSGDLLVQRCSTPKDGVENLVELEDVEKISSSDFSKTNFKSCLDDENQKCSVKIFTISTKQIPVMERMFFS